MARINKRQALHALNNLCRLYKIPYDFGQVGKVRAYIMEAGQPAANKSSMPVCPGMEKCENFGACMDCLRHPALRDKWSAKPAY